MFICMVKYCEYKELCFEGVPEYEALHAFGESLNALAEMESLTVEYVKKPVKHFHTHHKMIKVAFEILMQKKQNEIDSEFFISECANFCRVYHGVFYTDTRFYFPAMKENRQFLIEKHGF